jgi:hypothetical protein
MNNPLDNWRQKYGFTDQMHPQGQMSPQQQAYWSLNQREGQQGAANVNQMPFVLDPAMLSQDRGANMATMFKPPQGAQAPATPQAPQQDVLPQILALLQQNPEILPLLLQQIGGQGQQQI